MSVVVVVVVGQGQCRRDGSLIIATGFFKIEKHIVKKNNCTSLAGGIASAAC